MTSRLLILFLLGGGVLWLRSLWQRRQRADENRQSDGLPQVPAALRGGGPAWVIFTTPTCVACRSVEQILATDRPGERVVRIDATVDPELASRWEVRRAPTTLLADADGNVVARLVGAESVRRYLNDTASPTTLAADSEPLDANSA